MMDVGITITHADGTTTHCVETFPFSATLASARRTLAAKYPKAQYRWLYRVEGAGRYR